MRIDILSGAWLEADQLRYLHLRKKKIQIATVKKAYFRLLSINLRRTTFRWLANLRMSDRLDIMLYRELDASYVDPATCI